MVKHKRTKSMVSLAQLDTTTIFLRGHLMPGTHFRKLACNCLLTVKRADLIKIVVARLNILTKVFVFFVQLKELSHCLKIVWPKGTGFIIGG